MSWFARMFHPERPGEERTLLRLQLARFRQLLRTYGAFLSLLEDAAEKQGGGFVLDRQYVIALVERLCELADGTLFDLNVLTAQRNLPGYAAFDRLRGGLRGLLSEDLAPEAPREEAPRDDLEAPSVSPAVLALALSRAEVLYRERGQVACRGAAAGKVCNLVSSPEPDAIPEGSVLVAPDLGLPVRVSAGVKRAAAILLDRGSVAGGAARLARELRIPAIVGLEDATARLSDGLEVSVDADENVVYRGRIPELLDYHRAIDPGDAEEPEYVLLRAVRRAAFPLTLAERRYEPVFSECRTLHDLVHLAHGLAGEAVCASLRARSERSFAARVVPGAPWCEIHATDLCGALADAEEIASHPVRLFVEGLAHGAPREGGGEPARRVLEVVSTEEHALCTLPSARGFDMLDATLGRSEEANAIYCRFAPTGEDDPSGARGAIAHGVLRRLGFAAARTEREVSGWSSRLPSAEAEEKVRILGRLAACLAELDRSGWSAEEPVEAFMRECA